jgi:hypothetical protein
MSTIESQYKQLQAQFDILVLLVQNGDAEASECSGETAKSKRYAHLLSCLTGMQSTNLSRVRIIHS